VHLGGAEELVLHPVKSKQGSNAPSQQLSPACVGDYVRHAVAKFPEGERGEVEHFEEREPPARLRKTVLTKGEFLRKAMKVR
jgi:hypothetical protein